MPLVIASPWSRGGAVCSEVFDHTSIIQFMEKFLSHKTGRQIKETNISDWRRTICGDLSSVFSPYNGDRLQPPAFVAKDTFIESVHKAKFKQAPAGFVKLSTGDLATINQHPRSFSLMPKQEDGIRKSCALPYELQAEGKLSADKKSFTINFAAGNQLFGQQAAGAPFNVYAPGKYLVDGRYENVHTWAFAVAAGKDLGRSWPLSDFENSGYHLRTYGPNGFFREFMGTANDPEAEISITSELNNKKMPSGNVEIKIVNGHKGDAYTVVIKDNAYKTAAVTKIVKAGSSTSVVLDLKKSFSWYDFTVSIQETGMFTKRYAGHIDTGKDSYTDPAMGNMM